MRIDTFDDLAVELHDQAQDTVCRRVLRTEIDRVIGDDLVACRRRLVELHAAHDASPSVSLLRVFRRLGSASAYVSELFAWRFVRVWRASLVSGAPGSGTTDASGPGCPSPG